MIPAREALERLQAGNRRFVAGELTFDPRGIQALRSDLVEGQEPFAVVLGCSDSRVPVEIVFDQALGDLFVVRVAGNVVAASQVGSVEFAVEQLGTRLVVVLGHTGCGAIRASVEALERKGGAPSPGLRSIVDRVRPSIEGLMETELGRDHAALLRAAVRANVRASADHLRHGSALLEQRVREDGLAIVGAEYALETGAVDFFDGADGVGGVGG